MQVFLENRSGVEKLEDQVLISTPFLNQLETERKGKLLELDQVYEIVGWNNIKDSVTIRGREM